MKYFNLSLTVLVISVFGNAIDVLSGGPDALAKGGDNKVVWHSFDEGMAKAAKEKKNVLIDFYTSWCHWCKTMDEKTFSNSEVAKKLKKQFVSIRINAESNTEKATYKGETYTNVQLTQSFGVRGFPSLAFLDKQGEPITVVPGFIPPETFVYILDYVNQECYKKQMSFEDFMKKKGECDEVKK